MELLQDPGEGLPVLLQRPLVLGARRVVVVRHLGELLLGDGLVLHDIGDLPHLRRDLASPNPSSAARHGTERELSREFRIQRSDSSMEDGDGAALLPCSRLWRDQTPVGARNGGCGEEESNIREDVLTLGASACTDITIRIISE